ncbi:MAG TPA: YCF48-related protein [Blastocatellia bacterium]|nr:YCF48-related protein [Blastocatellia bacterium]
MKLYRLFPILTLLIVCSFVALTRADDASHIVSSSTSGSEVRQWEVTGPWGGDVRSLVASPSDSSMLYLGTSDGQIFRSKDGARTWQRLHPGLERRGLSVDHIVIDPRNPKTVYAGAWAVARDEQGGVFRSEDGGEHWKLLDGTKGLSVRSLAMAPSDSSFLIAGSANDDPNLNGVFRSTDAGKKWERISPVGDKEIRNIESVAIDPRNTNIMYIGTWHLPWKTTDAGASWKQTGYKAVGMIDDSDIFGISINPANAEQVYINACSGIYRSGSAGEKWMKIPGIPFSARRTYKLLVHPSNPKIIFAGTSEGLWRSKDDGKKWMLLTSKTLVIRSIVVTPDNPNRVLIATDDLGIRTSENLGDDFIDSNIGFINRHVLAIMPDATERGRLLASVFHDGSGGSVFASIDGGQNWQSSSRGLAGRDVFSFYQMPNDPNVIYAGTNTGVYRSNDRGSSWSSTGVEQGNKLDKTPVKSKKPARGRAPARNTRSKRASIEWPPTAVGRYEALPASKHSSSHKSKSAQPAKKTSAKVTKASKKEKPAAISQSQRRQPRKETAKTEFAPLPGFAPLTREVDDITSFSDESGRVGLLAATMDGLYRTFDESRGWEKVTISGYESNGRVFSVSTHKDTPRKVFVGTKQGLFISTDGCSTWQHVDKGPTDVSVKAIAQDPRDAQLVIIGTNQYIFRSTNGGRTWVRRGGGLPSGDFTSVVISPTNPDEVLASEYSKGGVYRSTDKGYIWERIDVELPSNRVWTIMFDPFERDRAYVGSFSSGVYVFTIQRRASSTAQQ